MSRNVYCYKLKKNLPGIEYKPLPGELGQKIYDEISMEAWKLWQIEQTKLINENKLNMSQQKDRDFLFQELEKFLF